MTEVLGAFASVITIAAVAFELCTSSHNIISSFQSQRKDVKEIQSDLGALIAILELIQQRGRGSATCNDDTLEPLRGPLQCCQAVVQEIHDMLKKCTQHSKDGRESVRTWLNLQYRGKGFTDAKQRLASYKSTLAIAFDLMRMNDHAITQESLDSLKQLVGQTKEELEDQLDQVQQALHTADVSTRDILARDRAQIQSCLNDLELAQKAGENTAARVVVLGNVGAPNCRFFAGTDSVDPSLSLLVKQNEAQEGATMVAGVFSPEVLMDLLRQSPSRPNVVSLFQATQTHGMTLDTQAVHGILQGRSVAQQPERTQRRIGES